jgi:hypothetical protein
LCPLIIIFPSPSLCHAPLITIFALTPLHMKSVFATSFPIQNNHFDHQMRSN